jgi:peptidoglycan/xylan/chitin deacetylase (PgdA/CDA1 family)
MYHYISVPPQDADVYRQDLSITPDRFRQQMKWLSDHGYEPITLDHLMYALNIGNPSLPDKPVILTFDDGYVDNYENAFPVLQEFGFTGTFFILTDVTDREQPGYMSWEMLEEMSQAGMQIEVHGREHIELIDRDREFLRYHLLGPLQTIEATLGERPHFISYPSGRYDETVISVAEELGYWGAVTTIHGTTQDKDMPFELQRLRIRGSWSLDTFAAVVTES